MTDPNPSGDLVRQARATGDFTPIAAAYWERIHDFCSRMLSNEADADEVTQEVFLAAQLGLGKLRRPERLGPWLYAIARNGVHEQYRLRKKGSPLDPADLSEEADDVGGEVGRGVEADQAVRLVWTSARGLSERDQEVLLLTVRHGLDGRELADALGLGSANHAAVLAKRAKERLSQSIRALVTARSAASIDCEVLHGQLEGWSGQWDRPLAKSIHRHLTSCSTCGPLSDEDGKLHPARLYSAIPVALGLGAAQTLKGTTQPPDLALSELTSHTAPADPGGMPTEGGVWGPGAGKDPIRLLPDRGSRRRALALGTAAVVLLLLLLVLGPVVERIPPWNDSSADEIAATSSTTSTSTTTAAAEAPVGTGDGDPAAGGGEEVAVVIPPACEVFTAEHYYGYAFGVTDLGQIQQAGSGEHCSYSAPGVDSKNAIPISVHITSDANAEGCTGADVVEAPATDTFADPLGDITGSVTQLSGDTWRSCVHSAEHGWTASVLITREPGGTVQQGDQPPEPAGQHTVRAIANCVAGLVDWIVDPQVFVTCQQRG